MQPDRDFFDPVNVKLLMGNEVVCPPDWYGTDCNYAFHKFYYFLGGDGTLEIAGETFKPKPHDLYFIPAGTTHSYSHDPQNPVHKFWCHFEMTLGSGCRIAYSPETLFAHLPGDRVPRLFRNLLQWDRRDDPLDMLREKVLLLKLLMTFLRNVPMERMLEKESNPFTSMMNRYIVDHLHENIMLRDLAEQVPMHPNYFIRYFRKSFGMTPVEYIHELRLRKAKDMLQKDSRAAIGDVAQVVGFHDYRYFSRVFKKKYGMTPSMYQKYH